jgi:cell division protein FtsN
MKRKGKESKLNVLLTALLVVFMSLLSFSIGVISGKGWSDREYKVRHIEKDSHLKAAMEDSEPLGDEMTQKEVEMLTKRALQEAQAEAPNMNPETKTENQTQDGRDPASASPLDQMEAQMKSEQDNPKVTSQENKDGEDEDQDGAEEGPIGASSQAIKMKDSKAKRKVSSLPPRPSTPKPAAVDYTVQVAAYKTMKEAEIHSEKLIDKGFPAFPVKAMINGQLWYRVSIGSFKSRKQAMKYEKELKRQAVVKSTFVQKIERLKK